MRPVIAALVLCVLLQLTIVIGADAGDVRPLQLRGNALLRNGIERSPTFRQLVDEIRRSDVVVYVDLDPFDTRRLDGVLAFVGISRDTRFLRVWLRPARSDTDLIVSLGHELQHAVEVARAGRVVSRASFDALYRDVGEPCNSGRYETRAAREIAERVRADLRAPVE